MSVILDFDRNSRPDLARRPEEHVDLHAVQCQFHGLMTLLVQVSHQIDGMLACVSDIMATTPGGAEYIGQIDTARDAVARAYDQLQRIDHSAVMNTP